MKDYSKMSDNEINKRVAYVLGYKTQGVGWIDNADGIYDYIAKSDHHTAYRHALPNYCNSWADAGEIIQEYGIELGYDGVSWEASCNLRGIAPYSDWKKYPESPCRLAMIVFLMMHDKGEE